MIARVDASQTPQAARMSIIGLDASEIARVAGLAPAVVEVVERIASTNAALMAQPGSGGVRPVQLLAAAHQFEGRGRRGRGFLSDPAGSITFSVALERARTASAPALTGLPLALGVAVAECAARHVDGVALKWPNDLLCGGRKCAGMLVETRAAGSRDRVVIGLGVNLRLPQEIAAQIDQPVIGLFDGAPERMPSREVLIGELARALIDAATRFFANGFGDTATRWARFDAFAGREVSILEGGRCLTSGIAVGLDATGALLLRTDAGVTAIAAGDVSARAVGR
jgi:BirA family biotin operon repressor/biotin-[acetyl-CoA-carboxylase] ligase